MPEAITEPHGNARGRLTSARLSLAHMPDLIPTESPAEFYSKRKPSKTVVGLGIVPGTTCFLLPAKYPGCGAL